MKVRKGGKYRYVACMADRLFPPVNPIADGEIVVVEWHATGTNSAGVTNLDGSMFLGVVSKDSLYPKNISLADFLMEKK